MASDTLAEKPEPLLRDPRPRRYTAPACSSDHVTNLIYQDLDPEQKEIRMLGVEPGIGDER